ncbi:hypothetical protein BGX28_003261 [Mortierella sp. GBA30]|nr:hypothetical protein BGX28_003261 [Mortierella sp. GBA30]
MSSLRKSVKINSPLPKDLAGECKKASKILNAFIDPIAAKGIDNIIPSDILSKAKGLAIFTVVKAGFLFSGRAGAGIVVARLEDGSWSAPSAIGTGGMGFGGQIGAEITDFVIVLNTRAAVKSFTTGGNVTLGGNLSVAAGPIGRTAEAGASATIGSIAAIYSYSKTKGLFAGVSIEGSIIVERKDANESFYRRSVSAAELLSGAVPPPPQADILYRALNSKASGGYGYSRTGSMPGSEDYNPLYNTTNNNTSSINRSATTAHSGRYGGHHQAGIDAYNNENPVGRGRSATTGTYNNYGYSADDKSRGFGASLNSSSSAALAGAVEQDYPVPRYTPTEVSTTPFQGRNQPTRMPPTIGAKPEIVIAMYDFTGEQSTDLSFRKGDRITVVKKTQSTNDWWTGRCNGQEGSFPANYVQ